MGAALCAGMRGLEAIALQDAYLLMIMTQLSVATGSKDENPKESGGGDTQKYEDGRHQPFARSRLVNLVTMPPQPPLRGDAAAYPGLYS